jgi:hypothetical protein
MTQSGVIGQKSEETSLWARIEELVIQSFAQHGVLHLSLRLGLELGKKWLIEMRFGFFMWVSVCMGLHCA